MEYVYKLNLPPVTDILMPDALSKLNHNPDHPVVELFLADQVIKSPWLTFNGCRWTTAVYFYKPLNFVGRIHHDTDKPGEMPWAINWIWGGTGRLDYYLPENIPPPRTMINHLGYPVTEYAGLGSDQYQPDKKYIMTPGAYLVNAALPHQPSSLGQRHCWSMRSNENYNLSWDVVVDKFHDYIA
jgi:hypothetical protein